MINEPVTGRPRLVRTAALVALTVSMGGVLAACGTGSDDDSGASKTAASASCPSDIGSVAKLQPPSGFPLPANATMAYKDLKQGSTTYYYYAISGGPTNIYGDRDAYDVLLKNAGHKITDTDQESGAEAESSFGGSPIGATKWDNLCSGMLVFQLSLGGGGDDD